jgi:macrolide transport system ATP-binding/permease protein
MTAPIDSARTSWRSRFRAWSPWGDLQHAARLLRARPGFTLAAGLSLALGLGLNIAIFTLINTLLLEPLPVRAPERVVAIYTSDFSGPAYGSSSYADAQDFQSQNSALEAVAAYTVRPLSMSRGDRTERVYAEVVSPQYFRVVGAQAALGQTFNEQDAANPGTANVVVLGTRFWQRAFGGDPKIVGKPIQLNGGIFTVVGVMPASYPGIIRGIVADLWVPATMQSQISPGDTYLTSRGSRGFMVIGRLREGASIDQARAQFDVIAQRLQNAYHDNWTDVHSERRRISVLRESESRLPPQVMGGVTAFLSLLLGLVFLVLLVACANVAGLLLARAVARRREMAIRLSLGASRMRLVRQLLTESLLVATGGGLLGVLIATWTMEGIGKLRPPMSLPLLTDFSIDSRVLLFAIGLSLLTSVIFGVAPALQSAKPDLVPALQGHELGLGDRRRRVTLRSALVVAQVALSLLLLVIAGLFVRSLQHAHQIDLGFEPRGVLTMSFDLGQRSDASGQQFYAEVLERVRHLPGVQTATFAAELPLGIGSSRYGVTIGDYQPARGEDMEVHGNMVGPDYFAAMGIPVVQGREFATRDTAAAPKVVMVNEAFVARYWHGGSPLGKTIAFGFGSRDVMQVVGVVRNSKLLTLNDTGTPTLYAPTTQRYRREAVLHVKTTADAATVVPQIRQELRALDPAVPVFDIQMLEDAIAIQLLPVRLAAILLGAAGLLGLALAVIGLFGIVAQIVAQRTREIGIRMALGAERRDVLRLIILRGLWLTGIGTAIGLALAALSSRFAAAFIFGISTHDPLTFVLVPIVLGAIALVATYLPARRAARINPTDALRYD